MSTNMSEEPSQEATASAVCLQDLGGESINAEDVNQSTLPSKVVDEVLQINGSRSILEGVLYFYLLILISPMMDIQVLQQLMFTITADHWCKSPEVEGLNLSADVVKSLTIPKSAEKHAFEKCRMYDVNFTVLFAENGTDLEPVSSWPKTKCQDGWNYDYKSNLFKSMTTEYDLVCDNALMESAVLSSFWLGSVFGPVLFGYFSDRYGRKPVTITMFFYAGVTSILTCFMPNLFYIRVMRGITGFAYWALANIPFCWSMECVNSQTRKKMIFMWSLSFPITWTVLPWFASYLKDWRQFVILTSLPLFAVSLVSLFIPESISWLVVNKDTEEVIKTVKRITKINKVKMSEEQEQSLRNKMDLKIEDKTNKWRQYLKSWKYKRLRKNQCIIYSCSFITAVGFAGMTHATVSITEDPIWAFSIGSCFEIAIPFIQIVCLDSLGRRWTNFGFFFSSSCMAFVSVILPEDYSLGFMLSTILCRVFITGAFQTFSPFSVELLPTKIRVVSVSIKMTINALAALLAPLIIHLKHIEKLLPLQILLITSLIGSILVLFLPETAHETLPHTLEEGDVFGKDQRCNYMPCLHRKK